MYIIVKAMISVMHIFQQCLSVPVDAWTISFSPDSRFLASGSHTGKINLFGVDSGRKESELDTRGKFTLSIAYVNISVFSLFILIKFKGVPFEVKYA